MGNSKQQNKEKLQIFLDQAATCLARCTTLRSVVTTRDSTASILTLQIGNAILLIYLNYSSHNYLEEDHTMLITMRGMVLEKDFRNIVMQYQHNFGGWFVSVLSDMEHITAMECTVDKWSDLFSLVHVPATLQAFLTKHGGLNDTVHISATAAFPLWIRNDGIHVSYNLQIQRGNLHCYGYAIREISFDGWLYNVKGHGITCAYNPTSKKMHMQLENANCWQYLNQNHFLWQTMKRYPAFTRALLEQDDIATVCNSLHITQIRCPLFLMAECSTHPSSKIKNYNPTEKVSSVAFPLTDYKFSTQMNLFRWISGIASVKILACDHEAKSVHFSSIQTEINQQHIIYRLFLKSELLYFVTLHAHGNGIVTNSKEEVIMQFVWFDTLSSKLQEQVKFRDVLVKFQV